MSDNLPLNFEKLQVWQQAVDISGDIYSLTSDFPVEERFGLTAQVRRAVVSVASNIAEGSGRHSEQDFIRFLRMSLGSLYECVTELAIAKNQGYIDQEVYLSFNNKAKSIAKMLNALISSLKRKSNNQELTTNN